MTTTNTPDKTTTSEPEEDRQEILDKLWLAVARGLLKQLEGGEPTAATFSAASKFLTDSAYNPLSRPSPAKTKAMEDLHSRLPFKGDRKDGGWDSATEGRGRYPFV